ncbi:peptidoglycan editing factor PgeF [Nakamurella alba]|uniref:peptidoglycan editing factor PgeF n=1 Tax=Nakamurella alba TaxID=2665158 RepID=UPI0018A93922|nr:peptidoglycan editing factor PgeF [Nakamurella alba]
MNGTDFADWPLLTASGVDAVVTTRRGGVSKPPYDQLNLAFHVGDDESAVIENRRRVAAAFDADLDDMVFCEQVHRPAVHVATEADRGRGARTRSTAIQDTDAMVTTTPGLLLVVMVADCVPLVLHDPGAGVLGVVHAGWAGTVRGVTPAAVAAMVDLGARPQNIVAGIGPAISPATYQVGEDVRSAAEQAFGGATESVLRSDGTGRFLFDLFAANRLQLEQAGLDPARIELSGQVTGPGTPFYSHRAQQPTGRFAAVARLRAE